MWGDGSGSKSTCCTRLRTRVCAHSTRLRSQARLQVPIISVLRGGGGAEKEDCFLTTSAAQTERASGPMRAYLREQGRERWARTPGALLWSLCTHSPHAHTLTCVHTGARAHTQITKLKRIKVGEQSQEAGSSQEHRVPAEGHWETRKCPESPSAHDGRGGACCFPAHVAPRFLQNCVACDSRAANTRLSGAFFSPTATPPSGEARARRTICLV